MNRAGDLPAAPPRDSLQRAFRAVRALSEHLAEPLGAEDQCVQSMPDASPTKWHLAHTSWFFEAMLLARFGSGYRPYDERFGYLFNSYYETLGPRHPRPARGLLTRPGVDEVRAYRAHVDQAMVRLFDRVDEADWMEVAALIELGLNHEQQHQELLLTDIKHLLSCNPLMPAYRSGLDGGAATATHTPTATAATMQPGPDGLVAIGHDGAGFAFDNESPRHQVMLRPFRLASRPVSCGEYLQFIDDRGYARPELWLSDGWAAVCAHHWRAPLYWFRDDDEGRWRLFTLAGARELDLAEPVAHVSLYEAVAYATWAGKRLPTEHEWEAVAATLPVCGRFLDPARPDPAPHPRACSATGPGDDFREVFGNVWEWTRSSYDPYPGYRPVPGALGEYNGKFMIGQSVLRGGSCATPVGHLRASYRNFFPPDARWQFSGIRLAEDA